MSEEHMVAVPVNAMGESYGRFRFAHPRTEAAVLESMRQFGQIVPVVVVAGEKPPGYELIDGFKRLRACRKLGLKTIQAWAMELGVRPAKAAILQLNWNARSIREIEEALIVQSLHREDQLSQVQIALLLGRHKSWVCRRIHLVEKLCEEVLEHLKLGLIRVGHGRQLVRLPRGNQSAALATIIKHGLCCRETEQLVTLLVKRPRWEHPALLYLPLEILDARAVPPCSSQSKAAALAEPCWMQPLRDLEQGCQRLLLALSACDLEPLNPQERQILRTATDSIQNSLERIKDFYVVSTP